MENAQKIALMKCLAARFGSAGRSGPLGATLPPYRRHGGEAFREGEETLGALTCSRFPGPAFAGKLQFSGITNWAVGRGMTMKKSRFSEAQIAFILRQGDEGTAVGEVCRKAGISEATYYNWRKKYGGLMPSEMKRLRQLEEENGKLKKIVADLSLDKEMLQDVIRRKL